MVRNVALRDQLEKALEDAEERAEKADSLYKRSQRLLRAAAILIALPMLLAELFNVGPYYQGAAVPLLLAAVVNFFIKVLQAIRARNRAIDALEQFELFEHGS